MIEFRTRRIWQEIRNDHVDESNVEKGFVYNIIDGYKTNDDDEQGEILAIVIACRQEGKENKVSVFYMDNLAEWNNYAQEVIRESAEEMKKYDFEAALARCNA